MTHYETLGVQKTATEDEIKRAYRRIALECHPDKHPGDGEKEEQFKRVSTAYRVLSDRAQRRKYDLTLQTHSFDAQRGPQPGWSDGPLYDVDDIFSAFSYAARSAANKIPVEKPGADIESELFIGFRDAARGCLREVKVNVTENCHGCKGSGAEPGTVARDCAACGGTGGGPDLFARRMRKCPACRGRGKVPLVRCRKCDGAGSASVERKLSVTIPAGIISGQVLRLRGQGHGGNPPGDLLVHIVVIPEEGIQVDGINTTVDVEVPLVTMVKGGPFRFESPYGEMQEIGINPCTRGGTIVTIHGAGGRNRAFDPASFSERGDLRVRLNVRVPRGMTLRAEKLMRELVEELEASNNS